MKPKKAIHCRKLITLAGEKAARGRALFASLPALDDAVIISSNGIIQSVEPYRACKSRPGLEWEDFGGGAACPAFVNAHCHLQLSHLHGQTRLGLGFMPWLKSLVPLLRLPPQSEALDAAARAMRASGTAFVADYAGPALPLAAEAMARADLDGLFLYECFGFGSEAWLDKDGRLKIPAVFAAHPCAPAGHALYSTGADILRAARAWCAENNRPFAIHLAESPEEEQALASGRGDMADFFREKVYPANWQAPGLPPVRLADKLGLLAPGTLAVHAVQCSAADAALLAGRGTAVCLCPRSNAAIGVGAAPVHDFIAAGILLCLGTDSLASNHSLDLAEEAFLLRDKADLPPEALLRMLSLNGAAALGLARLGSLEPGKACALARYPF